MITAEEIIKPENLVYTKPKLMNDTHMHYCPGCSHGVVHKLVAEVVEEMGMEELQERIEQLQGGTSGENEEETISELGGEETGSPKKA